MDFCDCGSLCNHFVCVASLWQVHDFFQEMQRLQPFSRPNCTDGGGWRGLMKDRRNKHTMMCHVKDLAALLWQDIKRFISKSIAWIVRAQRFHAETHLPRFGNPFLRSRSKRKRFTHLLQTAGRFAAGEDWSFLSCLDWEELLHTRTRDTGAVCGIGFECLAHVVQGLHVAVFVMVQCKHQETVLVSTLLLNISDDGTLVSWVVHWQTAVVHFAGMVNAWIRDWPEFGSLARVRVSGGHKRIFVWNVWIAIYIALLALLPLLFYYLALAVSSALLRGGLKLWPSSPLQFWPVHYSLRPPSMCRRQIQRTIWNKVLCWSINMGAASTQIPNTSFLSYLMLACGVHSSLLDRLSTLVVLTVPLWAIGKSFILLQLASVSKPAFFSGIYGSDIAPSHWDSKNLSSCQGKGFNAVAKNCHSQPLATRLLLMYPFRASVGMCNEHASRLLSLYTNGSLRRNYFSNMLQTWNQQF